MGARLLHKGAFVYTFWPDQGWFMFSPQTSPLRTYTLEEELYTVLKCGFSNLIKRTLLTSS